MYITKELKRASEVIGLEYEIVKGLQARAIIDKLINKFNPEKTTGHLTVGDNSKQINLNNYEFNYSYNLNQGTGYLFFDQEGEDKNVVFMVYDIKIVSKEKVVK